MTRINTNVSSLIAQKTLSRSTVDLQSALTRLSTGLRINSGKDDPAGLIASENLRSDISSVQKAIGNSERANQIIATAESSLGQVSSLLNDIRGLVSEAANTGGLSQEQIAANQLQIDSSLESLNRIAQTTSFQGQRLLDGSLDFLSTANSVSNVENVKIDQANLGTSGSISVDIDIDTAASQAVVKTDIDATTTAVKASLDVDLADLDIGTSSSGTFTIEAATTGESFNDISVSLSESASVANGEALAVYDDEAGTITVYIATGQDTTTAKISDAIDALDDFATSAVVAGNGFKTGDTVGSLGSLDNGVDGGAGLLDDLVFELSGKKGSEVFTFETGATAQQVRDAVNLVSDATGVEASVTGDTLSLTSTEYGSSAFVNVNVISEGVAGAFETGFTGSGTTTRDEGGDIEATVNGVTANGDGNELSINTATLDLTLTVSDGSSADIDFDITGGGALFQLGPDVVSNQQARLGIQSVNTARLGGVSGRLYELGSGGTASLDTNTALATQIVEESIDQITGLRGRLGAFQKTTVDTNIASLTDTLTNLTEAESAIRDADFAVESANLTRAQILVQSGTSVLSIANSNPQNVLALLR